MKIHYLATGSSGNAYIVSDGGDSILLDAGIPAREIIKRLGTLNLQLPGVCLVTHEHGDHAKSVDDLIGLGVDVYASRGTFDAIGVEPCAGCIVSAKSGWVDISNVFSIIPLHAIHDANEPLMFVVISKPSGSSLLYATDTATIPHRIKGLTHLLVEANFDIDVMELNQQNIRTVKNHMSLQALEGFVKSILSQENTLQEIHLCHCSKSNIDEESAVKRIQRISGVPTYSWNTYHKKEVLG